VERGRHKASLAELAGLAQTVSEKQAEEQTGG
jgi:hypothetical protein